MLKGIGASQGFGIGKAVVIRDTNLDYSSVKFTDSNHQKKRLHSAVADFSDETKSLVADLKKNAGNKEAEILEGHLVMLEDPFMLAQMEEAIDNGSVAEAAVDSICTMFINMFSGVDDELTRQRASDVKDIRDSLLRILLGVKSVDISSVPKGSVLIAKDFTPSMTSQINRENVSAIITEVGGVTSHSAILARAMGIPAVLSVVNAVEKISDGDMIIADGFKGKVFTDPTEEELEEYPHLRFAAGEDDTGVIIAFNSEAEDVTDSLMIPAGMRTLAINPLNWKTDGTPAGKEENLGACFTDYSGEIVTEIPQLTGAYIDPERGALKVPDVSPDDYPPGLDIFSEGVYHLYDYQFFYRNLQENVGERVQAYLAGQKPAQEAA